MYVSVNTHMEKKALTLRYLQCVKEQHQSQQTNKN